MSGPESYQIEEREKKALHLSRLFRELPIAEFEAALKRGRAHGTRFEKGSTVSEAEAHRDRFMILLAGRIQGVREHEGGDLEFVQLFVPGEICGLDIVCSETRKCPYRLIAMDETDIVFIDYDGMFSGKLSRSTEKKLQNGVARSLANESLRRLHKIDVLYRRALRERVVVYLRNLSAITNSKKIELNMDREQFAQYLGVNRSALSNELSSMQKDGLIRFSKSSFTILKEL